MMTQLPRTVLLRFVQSVDGSIKGGGSKKAIAEEFYKKHGLTEENATRILEIYNAISEEKEPVNVYIFWLDNANTEDFREKLLKEINDNKALIGDDKYVSKEGYIDSEETEEGVDFSFSFVRIKTKFDIIKVDFETRKENITVPIKIEFDNENKKSKVFVYSKRPDLQRFIKFNKEVQENSS